MTVKMQDLTAERWWDVWIAIFAMGAVYTVAMRLTVTEWTSELYIIVYLAIIAGVAGLALGYSRFPSWLTLIFSTIYGAFFITWLFCTTVKTEMPCRERILYDVGWRIRIAIEQLIASEAVSDTILFTTIMAILLWIIAISATFTLIRQGSTWLSIIPLGITLLVISHYDQDLARNTRFLVAFLFFALMIIGRATYLQYQQKWQQEGVQPTAITNAYFLKTLVGVVIMILIIAWILPTAPLEIIGSGSVMETLIEQWQIATEKISDIFIVEKSTTTIPINQFADSMNLGLNASLSDDVILIVNSDTQTPVWYRHYWRVRSYDHYDNGIWSTSLQLDEKELLSENFSINYPDWEKRWTVAYTFTSKTDQIDYLYYTGDPIWISRSVKAIVNPISESEVDLIALNTDSEILSEETYHIITQIRKPSTQILRETPTDYPGWLNPYLQVPENFSYDIASLAAKISRGYDNPYDIAFAITRYLRSNFTYVDTITSLPPGIDPIEWFLFTGKTGFCNYFATAQVLMLRSLGIPARIAVGYAQGEHNLKTDTFTVRRLDRHAWPEVFFMDFGWVSFEPTGSQRDVFVSPREFVLEDSFSFELPDYFQMNEQAINIPEPILAELTEGNQNEVMDTSDSKEIVDQSTSSEVIDETNLIEEIDPDNSAEITNPVITTEVINPLQSEIEENTQTPIHPFLLVLLIIIVLIIAMIVLQYSTFFNFGFDSLPAMLERALEKYGRYVPKWLRRWSRKTQMSVAEKAYQKLRLSIKIMGARVNPAETPSECALVMMELLPEAKRPIQEIIIQYHLDQYSTQSASIIRAQKAGQMVRRKALQARLKRLFLLN